MPAPPVEELAKAGWLARRASCRCSACGELTVLVSTSVSTCPGDRGGFCSGCGVIRMCCSGCASSVLGLGCGRKAAHSLVVCALVVLQLLVLPVLSQVRRSWLEGLDMRQFSRACRAAGGCNELVARLGVHC